MSPTAPARRPTAAGPYCIEVRDRCAQASWVERRTYTNPLRATLVCLVAVRRLQQSYGGNATYLARVYAADGTVVFATGQ
jgi:hypothetical protein